MNSSNKRAEPPIAAEGGVRSPLDPHGDPYRALDDLMAAVEVLCPRWPGREACGNERTMLL